MSFFGQICIFASLILASFGMVAAFLSARNAKPLWLKSAQYSGYLLFVLMTLANLGMITALLTNDFSINYVAEVGARETPRFFAAISLWSSLEGSILFWGWVLSGYTALCIYYYRDRFTEWMPWVMFTLFAVGVFFYLVLAFPANPFKSVFPVPENGPGPNPLLQNHWLMAIHPPMLYLGYVGMSVPFAFAVASIVCQKVPGTFLQNNERVCNPPYAVETPAEKPACSKKYQAPFDQSWVSMTRKWFLVAWMFLSAAIVLGGWWSYAVLGWGGYWAWDPVENASFMPWLTGTAFLHSIMVEERRGMLKIWNLFLIISTFLLTILGTFLTRSGVLDSVHSFTESEIGHYFLIAIAVALALSTALLIWRGNRLKSEGKLDHPLSRETVFLINNLLFVTFCFVVLLGTLYPLLAEALQGIKVTVGEPFFNQVTTPLCLLILFLMGIGVVLPWRKGETKVVLRALSLPFLIALLVSIIAYFAFVKKWMVLVALFLSIFSLAIMLIEMGTLLWQKRRLFSLNPRRYGGFVVHIGVILITIGVAFSKNYQQERQVTLKTGEVFEIGSYQLGLQRLFGVPKPQRFEVIALMEVLNKGKRLGLLNPKLNFYPTNREPVGSPAVRSSLKEDLYLTLMSFEHQNFQATLRAIVTPAVSWIWIGGGVMMVGIWIAVGMGRENRKQRTETETENGKLRTDNGEWI